MVSGNQLFGHQYFSHFNKSKPSRSYVGCPSQCKLNMMKIVYLLGFLALSMTFGCNDKPAKETVKVVEVPAKDTSTKITIGPDGGSVKTKKVDIEIKNKN